MLFPRYVLENAQAGADGSFTVAYADGSKEDVDGLLASQLAGQLEQLNVPGIYSPRMIAASRRTVGALLESRPFDRPSADADALQKLATGREAVAEAEAEGTATRSATIEGQAEMLQAQLKRWAGWWQVKGDSPAAYFNRTVNDQAGIKDGKRGSASVEQLRRARDAARDHITAYCDRTGVKPPRGWEDR